MTARPRALAALAALLALVAGLPAVLLALGGPGLPTGLPSLAGVRDVLSRPDDGTLALTAVKGIAWAAWAYLSTAIAVEVTARARRVHTPRLPGLRLSQPLAHHLVGAAAALFIAAPLTAAPTVGPALPASVVAAATMTPPGPTATTTAGIEHPAGTPAPSATVGDVPAAPAQPGPRHTVTRGQTLWSIAEGHLGAGERYGEIVALNRDLLGERPDFLRPGWVLHLPAATPSDGGSSYTVRPGDTLSQIALDRLGDAAAYPAIVEASKSITQPDGAHLADPDLIRPGWTLHIPTTPTTSARSTPSSPPPSEASPRYPRPQPSTKNPASATPAPQPAPTEPARTEPRDDRAAAPAASPPVHNATPETPQPAGTSSTGAAHTADAAAPEQDVVFAAPGPSWPA